MKARHYFLMILSIFLIGYLTHTDVFADEPPGPGGGPGSGDIPVGGGAPLATGIGWMIIYGLVYLMKKTSNLRKR